MTISSTTRSAGPFTGNATAATFPFVFKVFQGGDLLVTNVLLSTGAKATLNLNSDYTVLLNADQDGNPGGNITLTAGPLAYGYTLTITSAMANLQLTEFLNHGGFYPEVLTQALDRLTILIQQLQETINNPLIVQPCIATIVGSVYTAPANVLAAFVNGFLQKPSDYSAEGPVITFNYTLGSGDIVNALCTSI